MNLALNLLADDTVLLGVDLVQHHAQQGGTVLAVALLVNQLQTACIRKVGPVDWDHRQVMQA